MAVCEWSGCKGSPTHTVRIDWSDQTTEAWRVCRAHDRELKSQVVRGRPKAAPVPDPGACKEPLAESSALPVNQRKPCPSCGSLERMVAVSASDTVTVHDSARARSKTPGKGGWMVDTQSGDDYSRDLDAWSKRELTKDRTQDLYREVLELPDGTRIESTARLRDHHD